jgi:hypothetical protein
MNIIRARALFLLYEIDGSQRNYHDGEGNYKHVPVKV